MNQTRRYGTFEPASPVECAAPMAGRIQRTLTDTQSRALHTLRQLGAELASDFTSTDLRREYRKLARRLHPDSHPGCSPAELQHLSRQFTLATDSHQQLLASIEPRH